MVARLVAFLALLAVVSGCTDRPGGAGPSPSPSATPGTASAESFAGPALPSGWVAHGGDWSVAPGAGNHSGVLVGRGQADPGLSSFVDHAAGSFTNFTFEIEFQMVSGEHPQGAGAVFDWRDERNYLIIRYSISEQGWHLFTVVDGNRNKQGGGTLPNTTAPEFGTWVHLRVEQVGRVVKAWDGAVQVLEYPLAPRDSDSGLVGAFTRGDTVAEFDNFSVRPT